MTGLLVFLFLYTALTKFYDVSRFAATMKHNYILSPYADVLKWLVPITEIIIVILLCIPRTRRKGILISSVLLALFAGYISYMLLKDSELPCTCGGILESMSWKQHLVFNISMIALSVAAWLCYPKRFIATNRSSRIPV
ncbi:MAG: hypothetical protein GC171_06050 [Terrimonas sp.]|nr:hypothetical protein [Terrimonas sp.]